MTRRSAPAWFWGIVCASFIAAALVHSFEAVTGGAASSGRHALFVAINLGAAWGCWRQPRWFIWPFALLVLQQLFSHGRDLAQAWPGRIDWRSLLVLLWMPVVAGALWRERRGRSTSDP